MNGTRVRLNIEGFVALRNDPGVVADLEARAQKVAETAGDGFSTRPAETNTSRRTGRARVAVVTDTFEAMLSEVRDHTLARAISGGVNS